MNKEEQKEFNKNLALFFHTSGTSFYRIGNPYLLKAVRTLCPDVKLPDRHKLSGELTDEICQNISEKRDIFMKRAGVFNVGTNDTWTDHNRNSIMNHNNFCDGKVFFLESVQTKANAHTSEYIATETDRILLKYDQIGVCTDNTAANKGAWGILSRKYPSRWFYGCACHGVYLMIHWIFGPPKNKRGEYPEGFCFHALVDVIDDCKDIALFFKNHQADKWNLEDMQKAAKLRHLSVPCVTRWSGVKDLLDTVQSSSEVLHALVNQRGYLDCPTKKKVLRTKIRDKIMATTFLTSIAKAIMLIQHFNDLITLFQFASCDLGVVYDGIDRLQDIFRDYFDNGKLTQNEFNYIISIIEYYWQFLYSDAHGVAYLLHPRYIGCRMDVRLWDEVLQLIQTFPYDDSTPCDQARAIALTQEVNEYITYAKSHRDNNTVMFQSLCTNPRTVSGLGWWMQNGHHFPNVALIAKKVLSLVAGSAMTEREFSSQGFIHSKLRNRLGHGTLNQCMSIRSNMKAFSETELIQLDNFVSEIGLEGIPDDELQDFNADQHTMGRYGGTESGRREFSEEGGNDDDSEDGACDHNPTTLNFNSLPPRY